MRLIGAAAFACLALLLAALASWSVADPSLSNAVDADPSNWLGAPGAVAADLMFQSLGLAALIALLPPMLWSWSIMRSRLPDRIGIRLAGWLSAAILAAAILACLPAPASWPLPTGLGGLVGLGFRTLATLVAGEPPSQGAATIFAALLSPLALAALWYAVRPGAVEPVKAKRKQAEPDPRDEPTGLLGALAGVGSILLGALTHTAFRLKLLLRNWWRRRRAERQQQIALAFRRGSVEPSFDATSAADISEDYADADEIADLIVAEDAPRASRTRRLGAKAPRLSPGRRQAREAQASLLDGEVFELPALSLLTDPPASRAGADLRPEALEQNARRLESVLEDFGVKGDIVNVRPGPVVTLYELEPAPGIKSSRVISLADDIARSMSAISARVAVVPGRNAIGIELPNQARETVFLRELLGSADFEKVKGKLPLCLGKTIGGEPVIADLARMPHLLIAGTTGSGKSVAINTMILSLLYRMTPKECRLIMIDPKMLELSTYDGIPHLLTPVVTEPAKAITALKWAVREMEDRYRKMSKVGVRNIDGFNLRVAEARKKGKTLTRTVQTGFSRETGEAIFESEEFDLSPLPFIVVIVDEMADLMMVAGKDIEGAIQRLAQMARAAGIHLIMATQRPSVDVITGTIKANFPTRVSFQVTSKIDSRTILGEQGAEQLLGQGDMLYMVGGGRIKRLHGPFVSDREVEDVVAHLKSQGSPEYLDGVTDDDAEGDDPFGLDMGGTGDELYDKAVAIVLADKKASTSYIQRRLAIGYNRAATLIEKMEQEGVISAPNHAGKREILVGDGAAY
ncbi:MAG: DNA translocase FtsK 4TM domain-containing protein [Cucumibacter sp.]